SARMGTAAGGPRPGRAADPAGSHRGRPAAADRHAHRDRDAPRDDARGEPLSHPGRSSRGAGEDGGGRLHARSGDLGGRTARPRRTPGGRLMAPERTGRPRWRWVLLVIVALAGGGYWLLPASGARQPSGAEPGARSPGQEIPVVAATARRGDLPVYLSGL